MRRFVLTALLCSMVGARASANAPEDMFGVSARVSGMGGAGTAIARDGFAAYYNPGALSRCPDNQFSVDVRNVRYGLTTQRLGADAPPASVTTLNDATRVSLGGCILLPYHFSAGITVSGGLESQASLRMYTASSRPNYPLYGQPLEHVNVNAALAYRPVRQVSIGVGASILASLDLPVAAYVPVGIVDSYGNYADLSFRIEAKVAPAIAPFIGILVEPTRNLRVGLTYRAHNSLDFHSVMAITTEFLDWAVSVPITLRASPWFTPHQLALGVSGEPTSNVTLTGDLTWYGYGELRNKGFPYLTTTAVPGATGTALGVMGLDNADSPNYRGVWNMRLGVEGRVLESRRLAFRGGYALRSSALPHPGARNTTLLDGTVHSFTAGVGYAWNVGWDESADSFDQPEADAQTPGAAQAAVEDPEDAAPSTMTARIDAYARLNVMPYQTDSTKDIRWGGNIFDAGLTMTLGWR